MAGAGLAQDRVSLAPVILVSAAAPGLAPVEHLATPADRFPAVRSLTLASLSLVPAPPITLDSLPMYGLPLPTTTAASAPTSSGQDAATTDVSRGTAANPATTPVTSLPSVEPDGASAAAATAVAATPAEASDGAAAADAAPEDKDLWDRIRRGFKMPDLQTKRAQASTRWYAAQPDYLARMTGRASMYLYHIVAEIEKRGMPTEIALLPFVESAMQPDAVSFAKAAGLWQFIPSTGKLYALEQNLWKDERFGVIESTRAALDYLQKLYAEFGDWHLALAAYNCGEAGVERALARARAAHRSLSYADLRLPAETQYYVPKLQAIKNIVADPQHYGIALPGIRNEPYFVAVSKSADIDLATAARLAELPLDEFRALNPAFHRPVIVGASSPTILLPADRADTFNANLAAWQASGQPLASWTAYTLQAGETLAAVAARVGVAEGQLREANRIPPRYRPAPGSTLLIPRDENTSDDIAPGFLDAAFSLLPEGGGLRQLSYRVRRGDTLDTIAHRWRVSPEDILAWNKLPTKSLVVGQRLTLAVARTAAAAPHRSAAHKAPAAVVKHGAPAAPTLHHAAAAARAPVVASAAAARM